LWQWRNEKDTRQASFQTRFIPFENHEEWFKKRLADAGTRLLIALDVRGREVGYVRFEIRDREAIISVSIEKGERGKGYGRAAIRTGSDYLMENDTIDRIIAHVRPANTSSREVFRRAGYVFRAMRAVCGEEACEMVYERALSVDHQT
jgi:RimJ/RimL family protein N-acetyltransferase